MDTLPDAGRFRETDAVDAPGMAPSMWNIPVLQAWAADFPFLEVKNTALLAVSVGVDPFCGILDKSVTHESSRKMGARAATKCREKMLEDCHAGRSSGPFAECPFAYARICPMFDIPKNKNDPLCDEIRLISHFSQGGLASVNSLCYSPINCFPLSPVAYQRIGLRHVEEARYATHATSRSALNGRESIQES